MDVTFVLEAVVVLAAIVMGTRTGGVGVGAWGGLGTLVLVFVFGEAPGEPPAAAVAIILAVVTAASMMQAAGGIDWMVKMAAKVIERHPKQITVVAPLTAFAFCVGSGTGNIIYPLLPVIYDVSYRNNIRPSRPLSLTVVQSGMALAASPVSAAMAAMLTLTDVGPYDFGLIEILSITIPASIVGIVVTALVLNRLGKELDEDPEVQARIASGELARPGEVRVLVLPDTAATTPAETAAATTATRGTTATTTATGDVTATASTGAAGGPTRGTTGGTTGGTTRGTTGDATGDATSGSDAAGQGPASAAPAPADRVPASAALSATTAGRNAALVFLAGVFAILLFGLFPDLRPSFPDAEGVAVALDMTTMIVLIMLTVAVLIAVISRPKVADVPATSVFKSGMVAAIALFGIAWLTATFIAAHEEVIVETVGAWITDWRVIFALSVFLVAALTTSQSTATRTMVPIGLAVGLPVGVLTGMWAAGLNGVYTLPANGTQIAAANFDETGTTKLGTKLLDHSFLVPMLVMTVTSIITGVAIGAVFY